MQLLWIIDRLAYTTPDDCPVRFNVAKPLGGLSQFAHRATSLPCEAANRLIGDGSMFAAFGSGNTQGLKPAAAELWHLWTVIFPRRSITGRLVRGRVWRRHNGRHWQYKKFVEYDQDGEC